MSERYTGEDIVQMLREGNEIASQAMDLVKQERLRAGRYAWLLYVVLFALTLALGGLLLRGGL